MNFTTFDNKFMKNYYCLNGTDNEWVYYLVISQLFFNFWFICRSFRILCKLNRCIDTIQNISGSINRLDCIYEGLNINFNNIQDDLNILLDRQESEYEPSEKSSNTETEKEITTDPPSDGTSIDSSSESETPESSDEEYVDNDEETYSDGCRKRRRFK
tara:strand:+ start:105 stop:578 length:474 start_codon:yes stop_codon:yes gene_type:complete